MTRRKWTSDEEDALRTMLADGRSYREIGRTLARSPASVEQKARDIDCTPKTLGLNPWAPTAATMTREVVATETVRVTAPMETGEESADDFLARVLRKTTTQVKAAAALPFVTVRIAADQPIALSLSSDWHLTAHGATDVEGLLAHADAVRETPRAYSLTVGDLLDNPIKHKPQHPTDVPDELRLLDIVVGRFGGKMLGATSGNHDDWSFALAGTDHLKTMAEKHRVHYAPDCLVYVVEIVRPTIPSASPRAG